MSQKLASTKKSDDQQQKQHKVEIRSKHLKLHVSHHYRQNQNNKIENDSNKKLSTTSPGKDPEIVNARSRYMAWYQEKRAEMEKKRKEKKSSEEEGKLQRPSRRQRGAKSADDLANKSEDTKEVRIISYYLLIFVHLKNGNYISISIKGITIS